MENEDLTCPICDKFIFETYCDYDVCPVCGWENDGVQAWNHNYSGGANALSVNEARIEYFLLKRKDTKEQAMKLQKQYQDACAEIYKRGVGLNYAKEIERAEKQTEEFRQLRKEYMNELNKILQSIQEER